jgi:hypothetical protein
MRQFKITRETDIVKGSFVNKFKITMDDGTVRRLVRNRFDVFERQKPFNITDLKPYLEKKCNFKTGQIECLPVKPWEPDAWLFTEIEQ